MTTIAKEVLTTTLTLSYLKSLDNGFWYDLDFWQFEGLFHGQRMHFIIMHSLDQKDYQLWNTDTQKALCRSRTLAGIVRQYNALNES